MTGEAAAWHLVAGDWQAVPTGDERAHGLWAAVGDAVRAYVPVEGVEDVAIAALELPFFRRPAQPEARLSLYEIAIPRHVDALDLERWCYVLWDAADFVLPMTWLNDTLYLGERGWHTVLWESPAGALDPAAADLYTRFFSAFIGGYVEPIDASTPFVLVDAPLRQDADGRPLARREPIAYVARAEYWPARARAVLDAPLEQVRAVYTESLLAAMDRDPEYGAYSKRIALALTALEDTDADATMRERATRLLHDQLRHVAEADVVDHGVPPTFHSPALETNVGVVRCAFGRRTFDVQIALVQSDQDVQVVYMADRVCDDSPIERPLFVKRWSDLAFLCRDLA